MIDDVDAALEAFEAAYERARSTVESLPPLVALKKAKKLGDTVEWMRTETSNVRARAAVGIRDDKKLNLAELGAYIGVSKARAHQLVDRAERSIDPLVAQDPVTREGKGSHE